MIIKKLDDGRYLTDIGNIIDSKDNYIKYKDSLNNLTKPSDKELIELGKQFHEYYQKELEIKNIDNNILEINAFEKQKAEEDLIKQELDSKT